MVVGSSNSKSVIGKLTYHETNEPMLKKNVHSKFLRTLSYFYKLINLAPKNTELQSRTIGVLISEYLKTGQKLTDSNGLKTILFRRDMNSTVNLQPPFLDYGGLIRGQLEVAGYIQPDSKR